VGHNGINILIGTGLLNLVIEFEKLNPITRLFLHYVKINTEIIWKLIMQ